MLVLFLKSKNSKYELTPAGNKVYNLLLVLAHLRKSSQTFLVRNYVLNYVLETRNKAYTKTLSCTIKIMSVC